jgi:hypothetical protein
VAGSRAKHNLKDREDADRTSSIMANARLIVIFSALLHLLGCRPALPESVQAHSLKFHRLDSGQSEIVSAGLPPSNQDSIVIVSVGRGKKAAFVPPTDGTDRPFDQLGDIHAYTMWKNSGTALYAKTYSESRPAITIHNVTPASDEITMGAVAVAGTRVQDFSWIEVLSGSPLTSRSVRTTGPAILIAYWWGDAGEPKWKRAVPNNGFRVIDRVLAPGALVQCSVAVKSVASAGEYNVTWAAAPTQGAQLWLVAIQH